MARKLSERQFLALVYLDAKNEVTPADLPMRSASRVLSRMARKGYAVTLYAITGEGASVLAAARDRSRREAGI